MKTGASSRLMIEGAVHAAPLRRARLDRFPSNDRVRTAIRQSVEKRVVDRTGGTTQIGLQRPSPAARELPLGGLEEVKCLQVANLLRRLY